MSAHESITIGVIDGRMFLMGEWPETSRFSVELLEGAMAGLRVVNDDYIVVELTNANATYQIAERPLYAGYVVARLIEGSKVAG